ncbi:MAG: hypothetical protein EAX96_11020 [Candidatus Lokiarchaeota archaeon]|nr:hypothetical protein [Candidatus Lokiarchaeota archaeon]
MVKKKLIVCILLIFFSSCLIMIPTIKADATRMDAMESYIMECNIGPAWGNSPDATEPTLLSTFQSLYILYTFFNLEGIDSYYLIEWLILCKNRDNGYGIIPYTESLIYYSYYASWIRAIFNQELEYGTQAWILSCQKEESGYGANQNSPATLISTFYGLMALNLYDTSIDDENLIIWLKEKQNLIPSSIDFGGFSTDGSSSNLWDAFSAIASLSILQDFGGVLLSPLIDWIASCQNLNNYHDQYGAFSSTPENTDYSLVNTYAAIACLSILGSYYLNQINLDATINWILKLQNEDGGFSNLYGGGGSSLSSTYFAACILDLLDLNVLVSDPVPWDENFIFSLRLTFIICLIGIFIAINAIIIIKKRRYNRKIQAEREKEKEQFFLNEAELNKEKLNN